jgi:hypothetical protein
MNCVGGTLIDSCTPGNPTGADDDCDGLDQDCNGVPDDAYVPAETNCGVGECAATGQMNCVDGTLVDTCTPGNPTGADDDCDGLDQDCNGVPDDSYIPTPSTHCGVGQCDRAGEMDCVDGQLVYTCTPGDPSPEICDGLDNDCDDSLADDGIDETWYNQPTWCGTGECESSGIMTCEAGAQVDTCIEGTPIPEICNDTYDNDCDGLVDSSDPDCHTKYVGQTNCSDSGSGTQEVPYCTINAAIQNVSDGYTIIVRDGAYTGTGNKNLDFGGKAITVMSEHGPESTIIDCEGSGRAFRFHSGESSDSILDGFTIIRGSVTLSGGAMLCEAASPTIKNCIISGNSSGVNGGGIAFYDAVAPALSNCVITGNEATPTMEEEYILGTAPRQM